MTEVDQSTTEKPADDGQQAITPETMGKQSSFCDEEKDTITTEKQTTESSKESRVTAKLKKEVDKQLLYYIHNERRLLEFNGGSNKLFVYDCNNRLKREESKQPEDQHTSYRSRTPVSRREKKRLIESAHTTLNKLDVSEIWKYHRHRVEAQAQENESRVYNYSRHVGNIMRSAQYNQLCKDIAKRRGQLIHE